ncbi:unnamed protein product [Echinostoma caproni]|uniref:RH1 domain-containing protein n=1 Tax=Echinostoma caproni TaxID=27848 RepID=A0A3P8L9W1_9TREM|nr:unnamed protein product [Echinostoma caproni]
MFPHAVLSYKPDQYFTLADLNVQAATPADDSVKSLPDTPTITVLDVYDIAASIGKEFEAIIDRYGPDSVATLMPKVISVLEELEDFAQRFDSEGRELVALQLAVQRLELEKLDRVQDQSRSEKVRFLFFLYGSMLLHIPKYCRAVLSSSARLKICI